MAGATPKNLRELLRAVTSLKIKKPIFVKMPIDRNESEFGKILDLVCEFKLQGVIVGNLQKNRQHLSLDPAEVARFPVGNFSGRPTFDDSNRLISFTFKRWGKKLVIIGCGGVFTASDAYEKILRGASLVQLITGLVYEGPQVVTQINHGLVELLQKDGLKHLSQAVGIKS